MRDINRRDFMRKTVTGMATVQASHSLTAAPSENEGSKTLDVVRASDVVELGRSGLRASRLSIGTGSNGAEQRRLGTIHRIERIRQPSKGHES